MEAILTAEHLYKSFGDKVIFEDLSFGVNKGQKIALIGRNGEGKSTLLNMLFNENERDKGDVIFNSQAYPSYLPQKTWKDGTVSIIQELLTSFEPHNEDRESFIARASQMMYVFGMKELEKPLNLLSGGEQKKVALAKVLLKNSQFYVLDEPTNHLDMDMIAWLENYLIKKNATLLIVTHDRDLIDKVCTDIYELYKGQISRYNCDRHENIPLFDYYLEKKEERAALLRAEIDKARNIYARELDWINRMPQARGTKSKKRIENFQYIKEKAFQKQEKEQAALSVVDTRIGKKILEINSISKSFEENRTLIDNFSYTFKKGDKIAVIGHNGCGKSTLLNIIMGKEKQSCGTIIKGETINFGYYQQKGLEEDPSKRVIDIIKEEAESITVQNENKKFDMSASSFLEKFGFSKDMQFHQYGLLSGGEKRRLYLLKTLIKNPNFLILDEPTNDLDIYSLLTLEEFLINYKGCLLIVSHDRRFIENISQNHYFIFGDGGKIKDFYQPYQEYLKQKAADKKNNSASYQDDKENDYEKQKKQKAQERKANKLSYKEQKILEEIEKLLPVLEQKKKELTEKLSSGELSNDELQTVGNELQDIIAQTEEKEMIWLELSERVSV
ncbi:MAG: ABC-F family ATP-binding cassette domain-containing protein [Bacteroidales bacterium]|nr:ABC-F family ATP-binding cassette domain-containing protein [Bacteroidales bacterium]